MSLNREEYVKAIKDLLGKDSTKIKEANRKLYSVSVRDYDGNNSEPDLALAEAAVNN